MLLDKSLIGRKLKSYDLVLEQLGKSIVWHGWETFYRYKRKEQVYKVGKTSKALLFYNGGGGENFNYTPPNLD